jgi:N-dimethylarginine dimethylaminohydrolase
MIGKHDMFSPCIQAGVEIVRRPGGRLRFSAPGQVNINDAVVIQPKKHVVSSMGAGKRRKRDSV